MKIDLHKYNEIIKEMLEKGDNKKNIAQFFKVHIKSLEHHINRWFTIKTIVSYEIKKTKSDILHKNKEDILFMYRNRVKLDDIANKYGVKYNILYQFVKRYKDKS
jgi:transposase